jgi:hypothetical protein
MWIDPESLSLHHPRASTERERRLCLRKSLGWAFKSGKRKSWLRFNLFQERELGKQ